jgi:hypothetical protein
MNKVDGHEFVFGAVHEGFYRTMFKRKRTAHVNFYERLVTNIESLAAKNKAQNIETQLWITGHSLGGALASLFYARAIKTREINYVSIGDSYTFGSPHVGNLDFRNQFVSRDNTPFYNSSRLYRVYNINDPVSRFPLGFDDPNFLSIAKGPSGMDAIDFCHIGKPVYLHQFTSSIPSLPPDFIVESAEDLLWYWGISFISFIHISNIWDFILQVKNVAFDFYRFCTERTYASGARFLVHFAETASLTVFHAPSTYCQNLSSKSSSSH